MYAWRRRIRRRRTPHHLGWHIKVSFVSPKGRSLYVIMYSATKDIIARVRLITNLIWTFYSNAFICSILLYMNGLWFLIDLALSLQKELAKRKFFVAVDMGWMVQRISDAESKSEFSYQHLYCGFAFCSVFFFFFFFFFPSDFQFLSEMLGISIYYISE